MDPSENVRYSCADQSLEKDQLFAGGRIAMELLCGEDLK